MLDLQPGVHFKKIEIAVAVDDELDRAGRAIADRARQCHGLRSHRGARLGIDERARRLLDDLLVAALDRAFALAEMHDVAVRVAEHLDLDVARLLDVFLDKDPVVAKARFRLVLRAAEPLAQFGIVMRDAHALAAAAGRGLDHDRIADLPRDRDRMLGVRNDIEMARHG